MAERPPGATVQQDPSNAAADPHPSAWVQGQGYDNPPTNGSKEELGTLDEIREKHREQAQERQQEKEKEQDQS